MLPFLIVTLPILVSLILPLAPVRKIGGGVYYLHIDLLLLLVFARKSVYTWLQIGFFDRLKGGGSDLLPPPLSECAVYGLNTFRREKVSGDPFHGDAGNGGIRLIADKIALCGGN